MPDAQIVREITIPQTRSIGVSPTATPETVSVVLHADPTKAYVGGGGLFSPIQNYISALPTYAVDDLELAFPRVYDEMAHDPTIKAGTRVRVYGAVSQGVELTPAITDKQDPDYESATDIADFCQRATQSLKTPLLFTLAQMHQLALRHGYAVAEKVYKPSPFKADAGTYRLVLDRIRVLPRGSTAFVVDPYGALLGLVYQKPGGTNYLGFGGIVDVAKLADDELILPPDKFLIYSNDALYDDPRGQSEYRPAYDDWWRKTQLKGEYLRYLSQCASPSVDFELAEGATDQPAYNPDGSVQTDANGNVVFVDAASAAVSAVIALRNGSYIVRPHGSALKPLNLQADSGKVFLDAFGENAREITRALLGQTLATTEGQHMSRAAAGVHQDTLGLFLQFDKLDLSWMLYTGLYQPLVRLNYPKDEELTPIPSLGETESQDQADRMRALALLRNADAAAVKSGLQPIIDDTMLPELRSNVNLPPAETANPDDSESAVDTTTQDSTPNNQALNGQTVPVQEAVPA